MKKIQLKKIIFLILTLTYSIIANEIDITQKGATCSLNKKQDCFYSGIIKIECQNQNLELYMSYNGNIIKVKKNDNLFMVKDCKKNKINILITSPENFSVDSQDNTVLYFKLKKCYSYKFFELLKKTLQANKFSWEIKETELPKKSEKIIVPLNTLVIPIDPNKVNISFEDKISKDGNKVISLPTIIINNECIENLEEQINQSCLAFMNLKPFHTNQEKKEIRQDNLKVFLVN